jgi:hypothetical protein
MTPPVTTGVGARGLLSHSSSHGRNSASAAEIATAVLAVVRDTSAREVARSFASGVAELGAGDQATDQVEQLAGSAIYHA